MKNSKLILAYDGTAYKGWQKTKMGPSIEAALQVVLEQILQHPVQLQAASRTDAGVHANGQCVNFLTPKENLDLHTLCLSLNSLLPKDIAVLRTEFADEKFHPTLDAKRKEYHYHICYGYAQLPQYRLYSWHYPHLLDIHRMEEAAKILQGRHDYATFCNAKKNEEYSHYERSVEQIAIEKNGENRLRFVISGSNFLYKMVRNLVGTIVYVGRGKVRVEEIPAILASHDRTRAGITAPAHGLFLHSVLY